MILGSEGIVQEGAEAVYPDGQYPVQNLYEAGLISYILAPETHAVQSE